MNSDKIRQVAKDAAEKIIRPGATITADGICDAISKAVAAALEEYERQDD